jgi:hypothetical protein
MWPIFNEGLIDLWTDVMNPAHEVIDLVHIFSFRKIIQNSWKIPRVKERKSSPLERERRSRSWVKVRKSSPLPLTVL